MDKSVFAAMVRWPDVPAVYGWLSLNQRGQWRIHPQGDAISNTDSTGSAITSPQILQFIHRNYSHDAHGQWYFQNGPQCVYIRLDAAPFIFHTIGAKQADGTLRLQSHNQQNVACVLGWWLDDDGWLYVQTDLGPGLVSGRDLETVLQSLLTTNGISVLDALQQDTDFILASGTPFTFDSKSNIPAAMGFVCFPKPALI